MKDVLEKLGIGLNISPFMKGRQQLPSEEIKVGRKIASLRIHVKRAIRRIKTYQILTSTIPLSMAHLSNQIVFVLSRPALTPQKHHRKLMLTSTLESYPILKMNSQVMTD